MSLGVPVGGGDYEPGDTVSLYGIEDWTSQIWYPSRVD